MVLTYQVTTGGQPVDKQEITKVKNNPAEYRDWPQTVNNFG
jgi:hypothetical protein